MEHLSFPIGRYTQPEHITPAHLAVWTHEIETLPGRLETALAGMTDEQLDTPYRPGGWTVRQVVHHLADSHSNAHCRLRLALTEDRPTVKPYEETEWAQLADVKMPVSVSLDILRGLHARWGVLLKSLNPVDFQRVFVHPAQGIIYHLDNMTGMYAHHGNNHLAQITALKKRMEWWPS